MPTPLSLLHYVCPDGRLALDYRHGADKVKFATAKGQLSAVLHYDEIQWDDYPEASKALGVAPPLAIKYGGAKSVELSGGDFQEVRCVVQ